MKMPKIGDSEIVSLLPDTIQLAKKKDLSRDRLVPPPPPDDVVLGDGEGASKTPRERHMDRLRSLQTQHLRKPPKYGAIVRESAQSLLRAGSQVSVNFLLNRFLLADPARLDASVLGFSRLSLAATMSSAILSAGEHIVKAYQAPPATQMEGFGLILDRLQSDDAGRKTSGEFMAEDVCRAVSKLDQEVRALIRGSGDAKEINILLNARQGIYWGLPPTLVNISHQTPDGDPRKREVIDLAVKELISEYPESNRDAIQSLVDQMRANCYLRRPRRATALLLGPPGTGKTRFVSRLAEALGLTVSNRVLGEQQGCLLPTEGGHSRGRFSEHSMDKFETRHYGIFASSLWSSGCLNPIVFLDEAGPYLNNAQMVRELKLSLDGQQPSFLLGSHGGVRVDTSRVTLILASNTAIKDESLASRLPTLYFGALDTKRKRNVLLSFFEEQRDNHAALSKEDQEAIIVATRKHIDFILEEDQRNKIDGVRIMKNVLLDTLSYIRSVVMRRDELVDACVEARICESFHQRKLFNSADV